jgi:AcrR family transcriptional regulator
MAEEQRVRMSTDDRREQLLSAGVELFSRRSHTDVSIEEIAEAAGVSKGLLYHYFPTKRDFIIAALARGQRQMAAQLRPDPSLPPIKRLDASLDAFLDYVEQFPAPFSAIFRGGAEDPDVAAVLDGGRAEQLKTVMDALQTWEDAPVSVEPSPTLEMAIQGWLFFVEGAVLRWLERRDVDRRQLRIMLRTADAARQSGEQAARDRRPRR